MTTPDLSSGTWFMASSGCRIRCHRNPDGDVNLIVGDTPHLYELTFDVETFREVVTQGSAVLAAIQGRDQQGQAEAAL